MDSVKFTTKYHGCEEAENVIILISSSFMTDNVSTIVSNVKKQTTKSFELCEVVVPDWDAYLTPWETPSIFKDREFAGKARETLGYILDEVIPTIDKGKKIYIVGYSLAGLFALWSMYETDVFDGGASCSGSLWYPGWKEYAEKKQLNKASKIYLSVGSSEKKTKNEIMSTVEDMTIWQKTVFMDDTYVKNIISQFNVGGHFKDVEMRIAKAVAWIIDK